MDIVVGFLVCAAVLLVAAAAVRALSRLKASDAYVYVPDGVALAEWQYKQLPMHECAWCGKKVSLQRHHIIPWSAAPESEHDPQNLVVLCKDDHLHVAHGGNYKRFNVNLRETLKTVKWVNSNEYYKETHDGRERTEVRK